MAITLVITKKLSIPLSELEFRFTRSGGPGGQNVNKVETRVELLFDATNSKSLSEKDRTAILLNLQSRINATGILHVVVGESRSQWQNRQLAVKRFIALMQKALKPKKKRVKTKVPHEAKQRRLDLKKRRGEIKRMRRGE